MKGTQGARSGLAVLGTAAVLVALAARPAPAAQGPTPPAPKGHERTPASSASIDRDNPTSKEIEMAVKQELKARRARAWRSIPLGGSALSVTLGPPAFEAPIHGMWTPLDYTPISRSRYYCAPFYERANASYGIVELVYLLNR